MKIFLPLILAALLLPSPAFARCDGTAPSLADEKIALIWKMIDLDKMLQTAEARTQADTQNLEDPVLRRSVSDIQKRCLTQMASTVTKQMNLSYTLDEIKALSELMQLKDKEEMEALSPADKTRLAEFARNGLVDKLKQTQSEQAAIAASIKPEINAEMAALTQQMGGQ